MQSRSSPRFRGWVRWYNHDKGFGFLIRDDGAGDVFIGRRVLTECQIRELRAADVLEFGIEPSRTNAGKFQAVDLKMIAKAGEHFDPNEPISFDDLDGSMAERDRIWSPGRGA